jgi:tripartite-type tricarboxylate transporter receptor subunit TctC
MHRFLCRALAAAGLAFVATAASAQADWPNKPLRWVVPFAPGGPTDAISRVLAARLGESLGQNVVIDNRSGASGAIGSEFVARAAPDGYTLVFGTQSTHASNSVFFPNMAFDPIRDFQPLTLVGEHRKFKRPLQARQALVNPTPPLDPGPAHPSIA